MDRTAYNLVNGRCPSKISLNLADTNGCSDLDSFMPKIWLVVYIMCVCVCVHVCVCV